MDANTTDIAVTSRVEFHDLAVGDKTYYNGVAVIVTAVEHGQPGNFPGQIRTNVRFTEAGGISSWAGLADQFFQFYTLRP